MRGTTRLDLEVRPYRPADDRGVLELLRLSLGAGPAGERTADFLRWKHLENPFGASFMLVAEADGRIVGLRPFLRWGFRAGDRMFGAVRAVDTATHSDYRRSGLFTRLTLEALEALRGEVDFVFNTPNEKSLPGYLKMGWRTVGEVPIAARVRRPLRFARGVRSLRDPEAIGGAGPPVRAPSASEALRGAEGLSVLLAESVPTDWRLATPRTEAFLRWRYADAPSLGYRAVTDEDGGELRGIAFFRVRPRGALWETTIGDVIVRPGDRATAGRLLSRIRAAADVDHLTCSFPAGTPQAAAARRAGFIRVPGGMTFVANPLASDLDPDPTALGSWALTLGDLEVF